MNKAVYREPRTYMKYDSQHIIGYLHETVIPDYQPESVGDDVPDSFTGYQYEGSELDGGTIMPCADPASRDEVINAVIRSKYSASQEFSIQRHYQNDPEVYADEWEEYNSWCEYAKTTVDNWL
jgi:hypothetical protein